MPTPEASASSSVALRNANITELAIEEADSFKANESIMTQDQCLDNGHQANSNNIRSSSDKVSDDLNNSKNSVVSNGVNISVQEFNVDVNREYSTDLVMVQNRTVDADSPPTGEVLSPTSKQLTETPSDFVDSKDILDNSKNNIDANKSECANNIVADMTVITHQNSSENIRDIIANSEKANKNSSDSNHHQQLDRVVEKSPRSDINLGNSRSANRSAGTRRSRKLVRSENVNESEDVEIEDPIERLNKLRASISSALSEVKGVLKQYSTEQSCDDQNESAPSKQPLDDGPVRFRFVRKIRRRSVFSEDDTTEIPKTSTDATASPIIENKVIEEVPKEFQENQKILSNENQDLIGQIEDEAIVPSSSGEIKKPINMDKDEEEADTKLIETAKTESSAKIQALQDKSDNGSTTTASEVQQKTSTEDSLIIAEVEVPSSTSGTTKLKNGKTKKNLKKDRRASIAAVEINQISNDQLPIPEDLKTQRRPSDSGTLVKQTTRIKAKTSEKPKLVSSRKVKTGSSSSKAESSTKKLSQTTKATEKTDVALSPTEEKNPTLLVDSTKISDITTSGTTVATKPTVPVTSSSIVISPQSTQEAILESKTLEKTASPTEADSSLKIEAPAGTSVAKLNTPKDTPAPTASSTVNADVPKPTLKLTEGNIPAGTSAVKLNKPEATPAPAVTSPVDTVVPKPSPKVTEVNKLNAPQVATAPTVTSPVNTAAPQTSSKKTEVNASAGTNILKLNTPKAVTAPAVSTKVNDDLSEIVAEMSVTCVKPYTADVPIPSQQSLKTSPEAITKLGIPNQQITKSQGTTAGISNNKSITPPKTPSAATVKVESSKSINKSAEVLETKTITPVSIQSNKKPKMITEAERIEASKAASVKASKTLQPAEKIVENKKSNASVDSKPSVPKQSTTGISKIPAESLNKIDQKTPDTPETQAEETTGVEADEPKPSNVPKDAVAVKFNLPGQESVEELQRLEEEQVKEISPHQTPEIPETAAAAAPPKKKRKAKRKVVIRRIKRKLSKDDTFIHQQETAAELEICEKEIEEKDADEQPEEEISDSPKQPKSCLKNRAFEIGDVVMYAEHYKKTQVRWKKAVVTERITSISYKLNIEGGDERPAHISYIKKFTNRKVNFGGKEYLEIDYAQIEDDEEKERNYSIWNLV